ncbi:serine hydrolase domain-containing protein [Enterococcus dispar]|uniref:serine hydrolase domain-containing protein n=1 Tax=Enterococcus dispar TaxID=44009 RepID=UPI0021D45B30|nr:serine hydrolase [Enterococcus dispar]MCU7356774.1 beta-lactamase family protein [Enterococcus dispar]MDT2706709.1 serine hydrolase [Enterococcus dispar]
MRGRHFKNKKNRLIYPLIVLFIIGGLSYWLYGNKESLFFATASTTENNEEPPTTSTSYSENQNEVANEDTITTPLSADDYQNLSKDILAPVGESFDTRLKLDNFVGTALIVKKGQIILQQGYGYQDFANQKRNSIASLYQIGSVQKSLTATLIYKQIEAGRLTLDTPLSQFFPQIYGSENITIRQMLHMTSGLGLPEIPLSVNSEAEVVNFAVNNAQIKYSGRFFYSPVNYILLAGILREITHTSYAQLIQNTFGNQLGLKQIVQYPNWYQNSNHTVSYGGKDAADYSQVVTEKKGQFVRELGTGNLGMTAGDLYWYYHQLLAGTLVSSDVLNAAWQRETDATYNGGQYDKGLYLRANGMIASQHCMVLISKDGQDAVLLLSNHGNVINQKTLMGVLYQDLTGVPAKF